MVVEHIGACFIARRSSATRTSSPLGRCPRLPARLIAIRRGCQPSAAGTATLVYARRDRTLSSRGSVCRGAVRPNQGHRRRSALSLRRSSLAKYRPGEEVFYGGLVSQPSAARRDLSQAAFDFAAGRCRKGALRIVGELLDPIAQLRRVNVQVLRGLHIRYASILDQAHSLKLELPRKLPSLDDPPGQPAC